ncbi:MAG TPA: hypothetical protein VEV16_10685 [Daejeonella sp.]|nr:hypothetical protein [Daejeonella sp.]
MAFGQRNYRFKGGKSDNEQKRFWILLLIALAICAAIVYFTKRY